jgi:hypothetical protein
MSRETFTEAYITCALWSSTDSNDEPMDANYSVHDIDARTLASMHVITGIKQPHFHRFCCWENSLRRGRGTYSITVSKIFT